ncbi:hypothetical protein [Phaeobacter inhibens]|uniref:hypothetical protein n=1 Tax=Phaeobacter inhibens TaxID=221822 RepID=UPI0021A8F84D|nr:hypothetical protein [Phaeobacter inhibens]UWR74055.1 hypothetical protein K4L00_08115 [Phaeobacter inhibens]
MSELIWKEYDTSRERMAQTLDYLYKIDTYLFYSLAAFYVWFFSVMKDQDPIFLYTVWIPVGLSLLAIFRADMQLRYLGALADYLRVLENEIQSMSEHSTAMKIGWENWYDPMRPRRRNKIYRYSMWGAVLLITVLVALKFGPIEQKEVVDLIAWSFVGGCMLAAFFAPIAFVIQRFLRSP